ncbi:Endonuclease III [Trachipleistophora hominis]|uniref:Endonuclease III n=1 Tax=Trachipleistophora hominis TaxID=72359 RepID=L7JYV9_TRAHO|nr:Endonuclease III [Trachipleistophora hominis]
MFVCTVHKNEEHRKFRVLMMLILSQQTRDKTTYTTIHNLNELLVRKYGEGISPYTISLLSLDELSSSIKNANYYIKKAKNIKMIAEYFVNRKMATEYDELVKLPGIGNKIAFLYLQIACNKTVGIGVDTHVHRIFNRLGVVTTKTPEETRIQLEQIYDKEEWGQINKVMVGFGQTVCLPKKPKCNECVVNYCCKYGKKFSF